MFYRAGVLNYKLFCRYNELFTFNIISIPLVVIQKIDYLSKFIFLIFIKLLKYNKRRCKKWRRIVMKNSL